MKKIAIVFMGLWMLAVNSSAQNIEKARKVENRMVGHKEVDPMHWLPQGDEYFHFPDLSVEFIWNNQLEMLYVLKRIYDSGIQVYSDGRKVVRKIPRTVIAGVFMMGDDRKDSLCLGEIQSSRMQYWLEAYGKPSSLRVVVKDSDGKILFRREWSSER